MKILVVDDNKEFCENMKDVLELQGHGAVCAYDGNRAIEEIEDDGFSLAIVDIIMPEMDGLTLLKKIKKIVPDLPVLLVTGFANEHITVQARQEGVLALLRKPIDFDELVRLIARVE